MTPATTEPFEVVHPDTSTIERPEWLALRKPGTGSSDAAPAMEMSPWVSQYAQWAEKSNLIPEQAQSPMFAWRLALEPVILDHAEREGWTTGPMRRHLMVRSIEHPWMLANPDGLTATEVVEAKTAAAWDEKRWDEGVPDHYVVQAVHLMIVTGRRRCVMPVMFGCDPPRLFVIDFDPPLAGQIVAQTGEFWRRVVENDPPDPDGSEASMLALRAVYLESVEGKSVDLPESFREPLALRRAHALIAKEHTDSCDAVKASVMKAMGDAEAAKLEAVTVATWKTSKSGSRRFLWTEPKGEGEQ